MWQVESMATITEPANKSVIFWQGWDDEGEKPGESAILVDQYSGEISFTQADNIVLLSRHELKAFIKLLQKIDKE